MRNVVSELDYSARLEGLTRISEATAWATEPTVVYQRIADIVSDVLMAEQAHVHMLSDDGLRFVKYAYRAGDHSSENWEDTVPVDIGRMQWMMKTLHPVVMDYENPHCCDVIPTNALAFGIRSAASIPFAAGGKVLGMCSVCYADATEWDDEGIEYLSCIARVLGVAVQRIQASKKAMQLQMLDERKRLSAELHDGTSNMLSTLSVAAASVLASYESGDDEAVQSALERMETLSLRAIRTLRSEMLSLRTPLESTDGLVEGLRDCLGQFENNWGIKTKLTTKVGEPFVAPLHVSLQLVRILNECLSNVLRHADATCVKVLLVEEPRFLSMVVEDNGRGFDVEAVPPERLGLKIMRERSAAAGGKLTIMSSSGGTTICIDIPRIY